MKRNDIYQQIAELEDAFEAAGEDQRRKLAPRIAALVDAALAKGQDMSRTLRSDEAGLAQDDSDDFFENVPV